MLRKFGVSFLVALSAWLALPACAQTGVSVTIPGGMVYQSAAQAGLAYITPTAAVAIIQQKAGLNWKNIAIEVLTDGSIGAVSGGLGGVVTISKPVLTGLAVGHGFADQVIEPLLVKAAPSGLTNLPPILQMNGSLAVTSGVCAESTIFVSQFRSATGAAVTARMLLKKKAAQAATVSIPLTIPIMGATVTFTPQTETVLKNAAGSNIKQFIPVDVLACQQQPSVQPAIPAPGIGAVRTPVYPGYRCRNTGESEADVCDLGGGTAYNPDLLAKIMIARGAGLAASQSFDEKWPTTQKLENRESSTGI